VSDHDLIERGDVLRFVSHTKYGPLHVGCADTCRACCIEALPPSPVAQALEAVAEAARCTEPDPDDGTTCRDHPGLFIEPVSVVACPTCRALHNLDAARKETR